MPRSTPYTEQDGGYAWFVVLSGFVISVLTDGFRFSFGFFYLQLVEEFNAGKGVTAWVGSLLFGMINVAAPVASAVVNKYGCRMAIVCGSILTFLALSVSYFATSLYILFFTFGILGGIGFSMMYIPSTVALVQYFKKKRSLACGLAFSGSGIGGFVFGPLMKILTEEYQWRGVLLILAAIMLNGATAGAVIRPKQATKQPDDAHEGKELMDTPLHESRTETMEQKSDRPLDNQGEGTDKITEVSSMLQKADASKRDSISSEISGAESPANTKGGIKNRIKALNDILHFSLLKDLRFILFLIAQFSVAIAYVIPFTFLPDRAISLGHERSKTAWILSSISISNTIGRLLVGILADYKYVNRPVAFAVVLLLAGIACLLFPLCLSYWSLMVFSVVLGQMIGAFVTLYAVVLPEMFGEETVASAIGLSVFCRAPGNFLGPPIGGWIVDRTGRLDIPFVVSGAAFTVASACIALILVLGYCSKNRLQDDAERK